jgi:hypothetical protein
MQVWSCTQRDLSVIRGLSRAVEVRGLRLDSVLQAMQRVDRSAEDELAQLRTSLRALAALDTRGRP